MNNEVDESIFNILLLTKSHTLFAFVSFPKCNFSIPGSYLGYHIAFSPNNSLAISG